MREAKTRNFIFSYPRDKISFGKVSEREVLVLRPKRFIQINIKKTVRYKKFIYNVKNYMLYRISYVITIHFHKNAV